MMVIDYDNGLVFDYLGGWCPCQGEGNVDGKQWYFRARGNRWILIIAPNGLRDPLDYFLDDDKNLFWYRETFYDPAGTGFSAGYMEQDEAEFLIRQCVEEYLSDRR
jgi:hypothetical protein